MTLTEYRDSILEYLEIERTYIEDDIKSNEALSDEEKVDNGLLIRGCKIIAHKENEYELEVRENNTKLRPGDVVSLSIHGRKDSIRATIKENGFNRITLEANKCLSANDLYDINVVQYVMTKTLINLIGAIGEGCPGAAFLRYLGNIEKPEYEGINKLEYGKQTLPDILNDKQRQACLNAFAYPDLYCIQGPPGTGKTKVLASIANAFSREGHMVLIVSNTHQAVNNALNEVSNARLDAYVVKIGKTLKSQDLEPTVELYEKFDNYIKEREKRRKKRFRITSEDVIGMTLQGALIHIGMRKVRAMPSIVLVDEASQIPLVEATAIGTFGAGCTIFIGDDRQMPPIFHEKLQNHELSTSIFSHLAKLYPDFCLSLTVTYRMNEEITKFVSHHFYEPHGVELVASDFSKDRKLLPDIQCDDPRIEILLSSEKPIIQTNVSNNNDWEDYNVEEAQFVASLIKCALGAGIHVTDLAVITPYRRQVKTIRQCCIELLDELPLIDTVERLQGQDVDLVIMSMCVSSPEYYNDNKHFLHDSNRLNVMFSRAKKKVIVLAPEIFGSLI